MKKEDITGLVVYLIIFAIVIIFGLLVVSEHASNSGMGTGAYVGMVIGAIVVGIIFNAIIYELGHVIGAVIGGYSVVSVNILFFNFYKDHGHIKFRFKNYDGLTGETIIIPKEGRKKEPNPFLNIFMGTFIYAAELIVIIILFSNYNSYIEPAEVAQIPIWSNVVYALLIIAVIGGIIVFYNILPLHLDSVTDGYKLTMTTNKDNVIAYNALLKVNYEVSQGATEIEIPTFEKITDFTADLNLNKVYVLLDQKKYDEAEALLDQILEGKENITQRTYLRTMSQKIYIHLVSRDLDEATTYFNENVGLDIRRLISRDQSMPSIRVYVLIAGIFDRSESEVLLALKKAPKALKYTPEARRNVEIQLLNEAILIVDQQHPNWDLKSHLFQKESNYSE